MFFHVRQCSRAPIASRSLSASHCSLSQRAQLALPASTPHHEFSSARSLTASAHWRNSHGTYTELRVPSSESLKWTEPTTSVKGKTTTLSSTWCCDTRGSGEPRSTVRHLDTTTRATPSTVKFTSNFAITKSASFTHLASNLHLTTSFTEMHPLLQTAVCETCRL